MRLTSDGSKIDLEPACSKWLDRSSIGLFATGYYVIVI